MSAALTPKRIDPATMFVTEVRPVWPTFKAPCTDDMRQMLEDIQRVEPTEQQRFEAIKSLLHERFDAQWNSAARSMFVPPHLLRVR